MRIENVKIVLYKVLRKMNISKNDICLSANYIHDIGFDNFDTNCFLNYLETEFNILIPDNDINALDTVGNTLNYLDSRFN